MSGSEFEEYIAFLFGRLGYRVCKTSKGGDFGLDIIARSANNSLGIQCKRWKNKIGVKAIQEVVAGCIHYGCDTPMVVTNSRFTKQAEQMARSTNCVLVNRDELVRLIIKSKKRENSHES
jgi:restriction system protein